MKTLGWARVRPPGAYMLRRGAWYPVVIDNRYQLVVLGVAQRNVAVPRDRLQIRQHLPSNFSVVIRAPDDHNPAKGTLADLGPTYAVCPSSRSRVRLEGRPDHVECPFCGHRESVAWDDIC